ncbi:MAG: LuxR C-terminal-related transcriptional regulator [Bryobacteraceae bacterium]|jgi:two-component system, LuxR family, sensor kinase FixL
MVVVIALVDYCTLPYLSLGFLYLVPIMLAAGFLPRPALAGLCVVCAALSEVFSSLDPAGRVIRLISEMLAFAGCGLFVSELLRNQRLSLETQARTVALVETSPAAIVVVNQSGAIELANRAAAELMVPDDMNLIGQPIAIFLPQLQNAFGSENGAQVRASMQCQMHRGNGEAFVADVWFSTYKENDGRKLAAIIADVTDQQPAAIPALTTAPEGAEWPSLNIRQLAVLRLLFEGLPNSQIASRLEMTPSAVKNTFQQLFSKTGANNRSQLVRVALERYRNLL